MRLVEEKLGEHAVLHGCIHEPTEPMDNIQNFPAILVLPGGGFRECSARESEPVAMAYFAEGYQAFYLEYTIVTVKPDASIEDPMNDVQAALTFLRKKREALFIEENQIALLGFSGGSHLASAVATHGPERPDLLLLGYPGILHSDLRALECPDIIESVNEKTPATFIFSTKDDTVTPPKHALAFANALDQYGIDFELHIFRTGPHGLSLGKALTSTGDKNQVNPIFAQWFQMSIDWLKGKWGEFTIYGVNDGRYGKFSIDSSVAELMADEKAAEILKKYMPSAEEVMKTQFAEWATPRFLKKRTPDMTEEKIKQLDVELLGI